MTAEPVALFTQAEIAKAKVTLKMLAEDLIGEAPYRIHDTAHNVHYGLGSSPPFSPEFIGYIGELSCKNEHCTRCRRRSVRTPNDQDAYRQNTNHRTRTTRMFRKLRRHAPLEFDVLWMAVMYHLSVEEITDKLNDRAITGGHLDRYCPADVAILAVAGIDKASRWW